MQTASTERIQTVSIQYICGKYKKEIIVSCVFMNF